MAQITDLLVRWKAGDQQASRELGTAIYPYLREAARRSLRRQGGAQTLRATELANEAWEKLFRLQDLDWQDRGHLLAVAANVVRRVLVDYVRERMAEKRGGDVVVVSLDDTGAQEVAGARGTVDWLAVDQALEELREAEPECARVVELRVFSGLTAAEIAGVCGSSTATVTRHWRFAKAWLSVRLQPEAG